MDGKMDFMIKQLLFKSLLRIAMVKLNIDVRLMDNCLTVIHN